MEERQVIDGIIECAQQKIQDEIGGLIGTSFSLAKAQGEIASREDLVGQLSGSLILTSIEISGDISGNGYLLVTVKDAIRLGGTLIMLPQAELDELVESESYDEETEDSYGEIGNIITGIFTSLFEKMYDSSCRFERGGQHLVKSPFDDEEKGGFIDDTLFYKITSNITLDDAQLGPLILLLPAAPFRLIEDVNKREIESKSEVGEQDKKDDGLDEASLKGENPIGNSEKSEQIVPEDPVGLESASPDSADQSPSSDVETRRNDIDSLLEMCRVSIQQEVGDIVGVEVSISEINNKVVTKEQFYLDETSGKQVAATLEVTGDVESCCHLYLGLKDAIRIGSILLMLPSNELETAVSEGTFNPDVQDAYDEITRVVSRVYTEVFGEHHSQSLHFSKTEIDQIVPMKVDIDSDDPIVNQTYYLSKVKIALDGHDSGWLQMLFPAVLFGLETLESEEIVKSSDSEGEKDQTTAVSEGDLDTGGVENAVPGADKPRGHTGDVLIISDADPEADRIKEMLGSQGISAVQLNFRDNLIDYLPGAYQAVLLVMNDVDEQSLGVAIKISTSCSLPLIASGSSWTRSKVFKAVKYGVSDILLTPATEDDISSKISGYITSQAA